MNSGLVPAMMAEVADHAHSMVMDVLPESGRIGRDTGAELRPATLKNPSVTNHVCRKHQVQKCHLC
jgi:hypothetical protein